MSNTTRLLSIFCVAGLVACGTNTGPAQDTGPGLGEGFTLAVGQSANVRGTNLVVTFREVADDSRCPSHALILCVGEGDATASLRVEGGNVTGDLVLHTNEQFDRVARFGRFDVRMASLDPYPCNLAPIPEADYRLTLIVTRR